MNLNLVTSAFLFVQVPGMQLGKYFNKFEDWMIKHSSVVLHLLLDICEACEACLLYLSRGCVYNI